MDELTRLSQDLDPALSETERAELVATGIRLHAARPIPAPAYRGDLKRYLLGQGEAPSTSAARAAGFAAADRPPKGRAAISAPALRARIMAFATTGLSLLGISALGLAGFGPFAT